jgi:hypothetical protein
LADWQDQAPKGSLINQLQTAYPLTIMDATGFKVSKSGTTLEIQLDGIQANPVKSSPFQNVFEDGAVGTGGRTIPGVTIPKSPFGPKPRVLAAKEKVYLLGMEVKSDAIVMTVQTCGSCDPAAVDPSHKPYRAAISFKFIKGFLAATDLKHVQDSIGALLLVPDAGAAQPAADAAPQNAQQNQQTQAQPPPAQAAAPDPPVKFKPIEEPAPPPPPQPKLEKGLTIDQVVAQLGQPQTTATVGDKQIYLFKEWKITFIGGKVADIDVR